MAATKSSIVPASRKRFTGERKWLRAVRVYIRLANDALTLATAQPFHVLPGDSMHKHCALRSGSVLQFRRSLFGETLVTYRTFMKRPDDIWASLGLSPIYFINAGIYGRPKRFRVSFSTSCTIKQRRHKPDTGVAKSRRLTPLSDIPDICRLTTNQIVEGAWKAEPQAGLPAARAKDIGLGETSRKRNGHCFRAALDRQATRRNTCPP
jgi:hypothetical protein